MLVFFYADKKNCSYFNLIWFREFQLSRAGKIRPICQKKLIRGKENCKLILCRKNCLFCEKKFYLAKNSFKNFFMLFSTFKLKTEHGIFHQMKNSIIWFFRQFFHLELENCCETSVYWKLFRWFFRQLPILNFLVSNRSNIMDEIFFYQRSCVNLITTRYRNRSLVEWVRFYDEFRVFLRILSECFFHLWDSTKAEKYRCEFYALRRTMMVFNLQEFVRLRNIWSEWEVWTMQVVLRVDDGFVLNELSVFISYMVLWLALW